MKMKVSVRSLQMQSTKQTNTKLECESQQKEAPLTQAMFKTCHDT